MLNRNPKFKLQGEMLKELSLTNLLKDKFGIFKYLTSKLLDK